MFYELFKILTIIFIVLYSVILYSVVENERKQISRFFIIYLVWSIFSQISNYITNINMSFALNHFFYKLSASTIPFLLPFTLLILLKSVMVDKSLNLNKLPFSKKILAIVFFPSILYVILVLFTPLDARYYNVVNGFKVFNNNQPIITIIYVITLSSFCVFAFTKILKAINSLKDFRKNFMYFALAFVCFYMITSLLILSKHSISYMAVSVFTFLLILAYYLEMYKGFPIKNKNDILALFIEQMHQPFFLCNENKEIIAVNEAVKEIIHEFKFTNYYKKHIDKIPSLSLIAKEFDKKNSKVTLTFYTDKSVKHIEATISCVMDGSKIICYSIIMYEQTPFFVALQKQKRLAEEDYLTGIFNRRMFMREASVLLNTTQEEQNSYALLMLDIDNFKRINDTFSHIAGDEVLVRFTNVIKKTIENRMVFARYGGEEFSIIMSGYSEEEVIDYSKNINKLIKEMEIHFNGSLITLTVSIGVCFVNYGNKKSLSSAIAEADEALYQSKLTGKDKYTIFRN